MIMAVENKIKTSILEVKEQGIKKFIENRIKTSLLVVKKQGIKKSIINVAIRVALVLLVRQIFMIYV